ncbi:MAG: YebC/PmpR family DNA-binding transcriptional regulator [Clostridia bacterium]|nr:YebC/PmpR family DNA-binding transcriptional regulator [Clostridia bacterium]
MSGHSKWANIKRRKEAVDSKKAKIFSKFGKEITVAVKQGGSDPNVNTKLKDIIAKAKSENMPNDNISRCIQKASGEGISGNYEELSYEGFGPFGTSIIVEVMTDNKNRTASDVRLIFDRAGGTLGQIGSVGYMFEKKGYFIIEKSQNINEDEFMLNVIDNGADDFVVEEEYYEVYTKPEMYAQVKEYLEKNKYSIIESEIKMISNIKKELNEEEEEKFQNFLDKLDENDDVGNVWHNANI